MSRRPYGTSQGICAPAPVLYVRCTVRAHSGDCGYTWGVCVVTLSPPTEKPHLTKVRALSERNKNVGTSRLKISPADPHRTKQISVNVCTYVIYSAAETSEQL